MLNGDSVDMVVNCVPSKKQSDLKIGRFDTPKLNKGDGFRQRLALAKIDNDPANPIGSWRKYAALFGLSGKPPAYRVTATQGKVVAQAFPVEIETDQNGFAGTFHHAALPQRLFVVVKGINPNWTAGMIDAARKLWIPLGVWNSATYTTIDTSDEDRNVYIGNLVKADNPDLLLRLLPNEEGGETALDVHNPTPQKIVAEVSVVVPSFLAKAQQLKVEVAPLSTQRIRLEK